MRRKLTDTWLRSIKPPDKGRLELRDSEVPGLVLRVSAARRSADGSVKPGVASWSVRTRTKDGKQTRPTLGTYPAVGIAKARKLALERLGAVAGGADPVQERRDARAARRARAAEATVADRLAEWRAARASAADRPWSARYVADVLRLTDREIVPKLGKKPLAATTRADWAGLCSAKAKRAPGVAAVLYRVVSSFLNHAEAQGWIPAPLLPRKGAGRIAPPVPPRERWLTDDELLAVWRAADREPPKLRAFARMLILTAAREMEVADIAAGEVDMQAGRWAIPATRTKNGRGYTVPLGDLALAELRAVWPNETPPPDHRLLGRAPDSGFRGFGKLKARMDLASKVDAWRWHDLRRTARSGMARLGVPALHAEAALNHISARSALERTYDRHDYAAEILAALDRWQQHVAGLVASAREAPPLPLPSRPARTRRGAAG